MQSNLGDRRERTWLILRVRRTRSKPQRPYSVRYRLWMARWWELEPEMRMRLYRSAERNGGQVLFTLKRYPAKKRQNFEGYMRRAIPPLTAHSACAKLPARARGRHSSDHPVMRSPGESALRARPAPELAGARWPG
jgi:hypothetical protein